MNQRLANLSDDIKKSEPSSDLYKKSLKADQLQSLTTAEPESTSRSTGDSDQSLSQEAKSDRQKHNLLIDSSLENQINFLLGFDQENIMSPMSEKLNSSQEASNSSDSHNHIELSPDPELYELEQTVKRLKSRDMVKIERQKRIM